MNRQMPITIEQLCSDPIIDAAYAQLCKQWHLRKAVKKMNRVLETLCVSKAEKKTFIGALYFRVRDKGYDWLGYRIEPVTLKTPTGTNDTPNQHEPSSTTTPSHTSHDTANAPATAQGHNRPALRATRHYQLTMNKTCITNHSFHKNKELFNRLYEQGASPEALATYVKRWCFLFREQGPRAVSYWTGEWKR
ncbi:MAG: hypothetical protein HWE24_01615 [Oceanospirillaceae bacterium]|nr:hypothetical protein [Oceanospirillaceae bacterium]